MVNCSSPKTVNLSVRNNADYRASIYWGSGEVPLSGLSAKMDIKSKKGASEVLLSLSTDNGGLIVHEVAGYIEIYIPYEITSTITWQIGVFDLILYSDITNEVYFATGGNVFVDHGITKL